jgi:hypothetical protein
MQFLDEYLHPSEAVFSVEPLCACVDCQLSSRGLKGLMRSYSVPEIHISKLQDVYLYVTGKPISRDDMIQALWANGYQVTFGGKFEAVAATWKKIPGSGILFEEGENVRLCEVRFPERVRQVWKMPRLRQERPILGRVYKHLRKIKKRKPKDLDDAKNYILDSEYVMTRLGNKLWIEPLALREALGADGHQFHSRGKFDREHDVCLTLEWVDKVTTYWRYRGTHSEKGEQNDNQAIRN